MVTKKLTSAQKAKATREAKKLASLKELGFERKKVKRKRKPMSDAQKAAATERLAKAREARGADGSKSVHEDLRNQPEDHFLHWKKVKEWLKANQLELKGMSMFKDSKVSKERGQYIDLEVYISNMKKYLSGGIWSDFRYGEKRESRIMTVCTTMAYHDDGRPKRSYGTWYPDIATTWTRELEAEFGTQIYSPINNEEVEEEDIVDES